MIISQLLGGLGNQMFQYAVGRALALTNRCQYKLDVSAFGRYTLRRYELDVFKIRAAIATPEDVDRVIGFGSRLVATCRRKLKITGRRYRIDRDYRFAADWKTFADPAYLEGSWQSYKYFEAHAEAIRAELTPKTPLAADSAAVARAAADNDSVSIHVRRGDYLHNPTTARVHGVLGADYYERAIAAIRARVARPHFIVFSDDVDWARVNLQPGPDVTFVDHNGADCAYDDMRLMSLCRHNIIANSTFSWWGAWLNSDADKIVIYPAEWLADKSVVPDYAAFIDDLIPTGWTPL